MILDIKMPELDGLEVLRRVKRIDPAIEVVMITAYASLETVKLALTHGAFEYLIKPFSRQDLEDVVRRALERRQAELGTRGQVSRLVEEMRRLTAKTRELEEAARREAFEQSLRVTQLSILREISRTIIGQLDPNEITSAVTAQLQTALGYDSITIASDAPQVESARAAMLVACVIRDAEGRLGYLVADNRPSGGPIDPRERELLEMLAEYLAIALRNSRLYGEIAATKHSLEQLIASAGDAIITITADDRIDGWNPAAERTFGLTARQALEPPDRGAIARGRLCRRPGASWRAEPERDMFETITAAPGRPRPLKLAVTLSGLRNRRQGELEGLHRDRPRHHRPARDREPAAPGREAHRARPARRRHRPRLQQPPAGDPGLRPADEAEPGQRRADRALAQTSSSRRPWTARRRSGASSSSPACGPTSSSSAWTSIRSCRIRWRSPGRAGRKRSPTRAGRSS